VSHPAVGDFMSRPAAACHPVRGKSDMPSSLLPSTIKPEEKQIDAGQHAHFALGLLKWKITGHTLYQHCSSPGEGGPITGTCTLSRFHERS